jgi:hypothetical protein
MEFNLKNLFLGTVILGGLASCNNSSQMKDNRLRDSLHQDSLRKDSIQRESEQPVDSLLMEDSLSTNNRELRTP